MTIEEISRLSGILAKQAGCGLDTSQPDPAADIEARTLKRLKEQEAQELAKKRSA